MRLTLRTLLAYLDDVLDPAETREIGQKLQESPMAANLVGRVREVLRKRRLSAPDLAGPGAGLDPNLVAGYLDNTLDSETVAEVERVCLGSDVSLAEVAACHQILTLALGDPVDVPAPVKDRFYALGMPVARTDGLPTAPGTLANGLPAGNHSGRFAVRNQAGPAAGSRENGSPADSAETGKTELPGALKKSAGNDRLLPALALAAMMVLSAIMLFADRNLLDGLFGPPQLASTSREGAGPETTTTSPATATAGNTNREPVKPVAPELANTELANTNQPNADTAPVELAQHEPPVPNETLSPADLGLPPTNPRKTSPSGETATGEPLPTGTAATNPAEMVESAVPATGEPPAAADPQPETLAPNATGTTPEVTPPARAPQPLRAEIAQYTSLDSMLIEMNQAHDHWQLVPANSSIREFQFIACPEPFEAVLDLGGGAARITLLGGSALRFFGPSAGEPAGFELLRGKLTIQSLRADNTPVIMLVDLQGNRGRLELLDQTTVCGIEAVSPVPSGFEQLPAEGASIGSLFTMVGQARWQWTDGEPISLPGNQWLSLVPHAIGVPSSLNQATYLPPWLNPQQRKAASVLRRYAAIFAKEFAATDPVELTTLTLTKDARPKIAELAVLLQGLTSDLHGLSQSFAQSPHEEARLAAAEQIRLWLACPPGNSGMEVLQSELAPSTAQPAERQMALQTELAMLYPPAEAGSIERLLWGYSETQGQEPGPSQELVALLRHPRLEVRELAIANIFRLTGKKYDYRPLAAETQRNAAIRRWEDHLTREGALLPLTP